MDKLFDARENVMTAPPEVVKLVERFDKFLETYVQGKYKEARVRFKVDERHPCRGKVRGAMKQGDRDLVLLAGGGLTLLLGYWAWRR